MSPFKSFPDNYHHSLQPSHFFTAVICTTNFFICTWKNMWMMGDRQDRFGKDRTGQIWNQFPLYSSDVPQHQERVGHNHIQVPIFAACMIYTRLLLLYIISVSKPWQSLAHIYFECVSVKYIIQWYAMMKYLVGTKPDQPVQA